MPPQNVPALAYLLLGVACALPAAKLTADDLTPNDLTTNDFAIRDGDTVAFLGDSITAARVYGKHIENFTLLRYPQRKVRFINLGIGGDTAAGGLKRLQRDVFDNHVTLLTVAFGINDIGWGMRADEAHRQVFLDSIRQIVRNCKAHGVRVYICSAAVTGGDPDKTEGDFLQQMCDQALAIAKEEGGHAIDVQRTMREIQRRVLKSNHNLPVEKHETLHAPDTIHLSDLGQLAMAHAILKGLGAPEEVSSATIDAGAKRAVSASGCSISDISSTDGRLSFTRLDEGLPFNNGAFSAMSYRFVPMNELNAYRLKVTGLAAGEYTLTASGRKIGVYRAQQLVEGINIASTTPDAWQPGGPWDAQAVALKSLTEARDQLDIAARSANANLTNSPLIAPLNTQATAANEQLEDLQRLVAQPRPYQFVLQRAADQLTISAPRELQVIQRHARNAGRVQVSGTTTFDADSIQVKFSGQPLEGRLPEQWQEVAFNPQTGVFSQEFALPAGGWFSMHLKLEKQGRLLAEKTLERFGVGEVFVGAGQSNSTNSGQFKTQQTSGMVSSFDGEHWQIADDPQIGVADKSQGGSYYPAFGDALYEHYHVPIGIAATGFGGTSVNAWQPTEGLFTFMMKRVEQLGKQGFRAILWHQGESDVDMPSSEYYDKMQRVIISSRTEAGWDIPWFVAQVSYHNPDRPSAESTRSAQAELWADGIAHAGPDTDKLTGENRDLDGLGIHFSPTGLKAHGLLWAKTLEPFIDQAIGKK